MPVALLPSTTPLVASGRFEARFENGRLYLQDGEYPFVWVEGQHVPGTTRHQAETPFPVVISPEGLYSDPQWAVFEGLLNPIAQSRPNRELAPAIQAGQMDPQFLFLFQSDSFKRREKLSDIERPIKNDPSLLGTRCAALVGHETLAGHVMALSHFEFPDSPPLQVHILKWVNASSPEVLTQIMDRGHSLLDLAMRYHHWDVAEALWKKGVRWSESSKAKGLPLAALVGGSVQLRETTNFLNQDWRLGEAERAERYEGWLERWLNRWNQAETPLPEGNPCRNQAEKFVKNGMADGAVVAHSPPAFWALHMVPTAGIQSIPLEKAKPAEVRLFERWVRFWTGQGVNLNHIAIQRLDPEPVAFMDFFKTPEAQSWARRALTLNLQERLEEAWPEPDDRQRPKKPRF